MQRVEIGTAGEQIVGNLFLPEGTEKSPAVVFLGPLTSVKEQVPGHYAEALSQLGFVALAIDNRHFGESSGEPRFYEHPGRKVEDVKTALSWLAERPEVDPNRLFAVGVCAGAGYMSAAVATDPRIKGFSTVAGFFHDATKQREWMGDGFEGALKRAVDARETFEKTGESLEIPAVGLEGEVAMPMQEAYEYYGTPRGAHPNYQNRFALMSREHTLVWDAQTQAENIQVPTLMIHSEKALAPFLARNFYEKLGGKKEEKWMESVGQIDFYDDPALIQPAAVAIAKFFANV